MCGPVTGNSGRNGTPGLVLFARREPIRSAFESTFKSRCKWGQCLSAERTSAAIGYKSLRRKGLVDDAFTYPQPDQQVRCEATGKPSFLPRAECSRYRTVVPGRSPGRETFIGTGVPDVERMREHRPSCYPTSTSKPSLAVDQHSLSATQYRAQLFAGDLPLVLEPG